MYIHLKTEIICTGAFHKIDGIIRKENYVDIFKLNLKILTELLRLHFQMNNDPKRMFKVVAK